MSLHSAQWRDVTKTHWPVQLWCLAQHITVETSHRDATSKWTHVTCAAVMFQHITVERSHRDATSTCALCAFSKTTLAHCSAYTNATSVNRPCCNIGIGQKYNQSAIICIYIFSIVHHSPTGLCSRGANNQRSWNLPESSPMSPDTASSNAFDWDLQRKWFNGLAWRKASFGQTKDRKCGLYDDQPARYFFATRISTLD